MTNIRIRLVNSRDGQFITELLSPVVPTGEQIHLTLSDDVYRSFYIEGVVQSCFAQDGVDGPILLTSVELVVSETQRSRLRDEGRTAG